MSTEVCAGRRQAGMAQQFRRPQIAATAQQMRREAVPQRVRRRGVGRPSAPRSNSIWCCTMRAVGRGPTKSGPSAGSAYGRPRDSRQSLAAPPAGPARAPLVALPVIADLRAAAPRRGQAERPRSASRAVEQGQHCDVSAAPARHWPPGLRGPRSSRRRRAPSGSARSAALRAQHRERARREAAPRETEKAAQHRQPAGR